MATTYEYKLVFVWILMNLYNFFWKSIVLCGTFYCLCFLVITLVRRSFWGARIHLVPHPYLLGKGSQGKGGQAISIQIPYRMAPFAH